MKRLLFWGSVFGFLSVALGAFGAHVLENRLDDHAMSIYQTGVHYQMFHALAILLSALLADRLPDRRYALRAGWSFAAGIILFSGSLYALALSGIGVLGAITPLGGLFFLTGWGYLAASARKL